MNVFSGAARRTSGAVSVIALLVLIAPQLLAAGWKKAYFATTKPGAWARYSEKSTVGPAMTTTYTRLADEDGQVRFEVRTEFAGNQYPPAAQRYDLEKGFAVDRELIDYPKAIAAVGMSADNAPFSPMAATTVATMRAAMNQYAPTAVFQATETVDGKSCDRYSYSIRSQAGEGRVETGDLWLNDTVPFGIVKHSATTKDTSGKVLWSYEQTLAESGTKSLPPPTTAAAKAPSSYTLAAAYAAGLIRINAEVDEKVKNGERVRLIVESKQDAPFTLTVPKEKTSLHVDMPFDDLVFEPASAQSFQLATDHPAEFVVQQLGEQRVFKGKFQITMYEGEPLFSGSATMDWVK